MERRFLPVEECAVSAETREDGKPHIVGRSAVFYDGSEETEYKLWDPMYDTDGRLLAPGAVERIHQRAFNKVLQERQDVRGLFNHDPNNVLGRTSAGTLKLERTLRGLDYDIDPGDTTVGRDVVQHLKRKDVTGSSFAFDVKKDGQKWSHDEERCVDIREITRIETLYDVGPVTYPAYKSSTAGVRSDNDYAEVRSANKEWRDSLKAERDAALAADEAKAALETKLADIQKRAKEIEC